MVDTKTEEIDIPVSASSMSRNDALWVSLGKTIQHLSKERVKNITHGSEKFEYLYLKRATVLRNQHPIKTLLNILPTKKENQDIKQTSKLAAKVRDIIIANLLNGEYGLELFNPKFKQGDFYIRMLQEGALYVIVENFNSNQTIGWKAYCNDLQVNLMKLCDIVTEVSMRHYKLLEEYIKNGAELDEDTARVLLGIKMEADTVELSKEDTIVRIKDDILSTIIDFIKQEYDIPESYAQFIIRHCIEAMDIMERCVHKVVSVYNTKFKDTKGDFTDAIDRLLKAPEYRNSLILCKEGIRQCMQQMSQKDWEHVRTNCALTYEEAEEMQKPTDTAEAEVTVEDIPRFDLNNLEIIRKTLDNDNTFNLYSGMALISKVCSDETLARELTLEAKSIAEGAIRIDHVISVVLQSKYAGKLKCITG